MQKIKILSLVAAALLATTAGASAQGYYYQYGNPGWRNAGPRYEPVQPGAMYYPARPGWYGLNGANHPEPSSSQGDVGPEGNNNGTLTGIYRQW
ncbi:hypothetical protein JQ615_20045 [Bradyrhizobium jicamae]|uniref:Uncharacterized protein n=1 Tax=Bradyrhizobium jicamae TaxID=280332 RepID=A0ABS5FLY9_9BRAD|nr:hypothetical protein [Bradyrhizobium jicamae]MBR0797679.1 hypothetical protein [Bradyrhizobium jicamae]MBR0933219.1 hypothetical protein [Bradyrhizobium jicamae]